MSPSSWTVFAAVALAALSLFLCLATRPRRRTIPSPRDTLIPKISPSQAVALPYPPDLLPGARDVATPYGVMRVYEWGPKDGKKVRLSQNFAASIASIVHVTLTTPLVKDLYGRGYSDTPVGVPHDARLYGMQISYAIASSSLSWAGAESGGFSVVGFSLGGGIAMAFAADFPYLINSIILLTPGGIIRRLPHEYETLSFRYLSLLPPFYQRTVMAKVLELEVSHSINGCRDHGQSQIGFGIAQEAEVMGKRSLDISGIVQWQFDKHQGSLHSLISTHHYGPIKHQHGDWRRVCSVKAIYLSFSAKAIAIIRADEVSADLLDIIGDPERVKFRAVADGHGFPVQSCDEFAKRIIDFLGF